ncbi:Stf0 family sulfotransferase [Roseovarius sp. S4756]|uniref:Stf0 family sulfotransferase n=1 Tax=Roseovarius maritimus TaxID=3342637 RepID=UPI00372C58DC
MGHNSYIICTTPRSGSTLLCSLLSATGCSGKPDSHFHEPSSDAWLADFDLVRSDYASDPDALAAAVDAAKARGRGATNIFGLRLQQSSFDFLMNQLGVICPRAVDDRERIEAAFGPTLYIHLTRADLLDQAVSYVRAQQTGLWHRAPDGRELERLAPPARASYDRDAISAQLDALRIANAAWERWFEREGLIPLHLTYEGLAADPQGTLALILARLGLDLKAAVGVQPGVARLADEVSRDWKARFMAEREGGWL